MLSGGHGAGVESVKLLLRDLHIKKLRKLSNMLKESPYYQFVIEIIKVKHTRKGTKPVKIILFDEIEPRPLNFLHIDKK